MKIVGLRPLSRARYNEFPEDLKNERIKFKLVYPPYVSLEMTDEGNIEAVTFSPPIYYGSDWERVGFRAFLLGFRAFWT